MRDGLLWFSGQRFSVEYHLQGSAEEARRRAHLLCIDQTVEAADHVIPPGPIRDELVGRVEQFEALSGEAHAAVLSFPVELLDGTMGTFLHLVFGMASLQGGVRLVDVRLPDRALAQMPEPRLGVAGLRAQLEVPSRPLVCAVLKPLGLGPKALADLAHEFALGGVDIIKDDQSLGDHPFCPFKERVTRCAEAIAAASRETGRVCLYAPHVFGSWSQLLERATLAHTAGAGALLLCPGLTGYDALGTLARRSAPSLPLILHPDFLGSHYVSPTSGIAPSVLFGLLPRLAGGDISIYPTYGLNYPISEDDCRGIASACRTTLSSRTPIFPTAAGRMNLSRIQEMLELYGSDVVFILGSDIRRDPQNIRAACEAVLRLLGKQ
ncbi:MAG: hypothetical protein JSR62_01730 [Nitrospira sp.]|nr:hypothetical protein [Nitrospira sp.]